jgi:small subunit ribosomal protein S17
MAECTDTRCPTHHGLAVRGNVFVGRVKSMKPSKTVSVMRVLTQYIPKYERYSKRKSVIAAHLPECIKVQENDVVRIGETRKLSKTKSFVVMGKVSKEDKQ